MKKLLFCVTSFLLIIVVLAGCSPKTDVETYDDFVAALKAKGYEVEEVSLQEGEIKHTFFAEYPQYLEISSDEMVAVYEFPDTDTAKSEAKKISKDGYSIGNAQISWIAKPSFYQKNRLIVMHVSSNSQLLTDLEGMLGIPITQ